MLVPFANLEDAFPLLLGGALAWIVLWIGASVLYRKSKGKPLFPRKPEHALFFESMASGHSNRNAFTKLAGARRCLMVSVTRDALFVHPMFPFNLMFLPEIYGLEYKVERKHVQVISQTNENVGKSVILAWTLADGSTQSVVLALREMDQFLNALASP